MSDYLDPNNEELLKDFFAEAQSQVETLEQSILVLENDTGNRDAVDEIFRAAHTLKGGAGTVEMTELAGFTHIVEDVLDGIRSGKATVGEELIDALLASIDIIKAMLDARAGGSVFDGDVEGIKTRLARFLPAGSKAASKLAAAAAAAPAAKPGSKPNSAAAAASALEGLTEYEMLELREAAGEDRRVWRLSLSFNPDNLMNTVSAIHAFAALRDVGTVLKTVPDFEKLYEDAFYPKVEYFIASDKPEEALRRKAMIPEVVDSIELVEIPLAKTEAGVKAAPLPPPQKAGGSPSGAQPMSQQASARVAPPASPATQAAPSAGPAAATPLRPGAEQLAGPGEHVEEEGEAVKEAHPDGRKAAVQQGSILRVDSRRIDNLLNLVSETV
ncbi:MAG TPA: Hpt domain-containing protein, partial [Rectinemataceae bacterium]|nr:Hpt domain-containing protein [Rectinemataceae bacterium]